MLALKYYIDIKLNRLMHNTNLDASIVGLELIEQFVIYLYLPTTK